MADADQATHAPQLERLPTGIAGLDTVLAGGFIRGDSYLVVGRPGTGKTVLGNHLTFNHARAGGAALYATTLAETHGMLLAHVSGFEFFAPELVAQRANYVSIYTELTQGGLPRVLDLLRRLVREHRATLLIVDGTEVLGNFAPSTAEYRHFVYDLHAQLAVLGCTSLLLADADSQAIRAIETIVDGILLLEDEGFGLRSVRLLHVTKMRGVNYLRGRHQFAITHAGIEVYPRLEAVVAVSRPVAPERRHRLKFGAEGIDDMLRGGVLSGSTTLLLGAPGSGKTIAGLHFVVEGARHGERGLIVSFHETPPRLIGKAESVGFELDRYVADGRVRILWQPPLEILLDALAHEILTATAEQRAQRLFIDGITDVQRVTLLPERFPSYLVALTNELRARDVTVIFSAETNRITGGALEVPLPALSATMENIVLLHYVELRSQIRRLISILKVRESDYDTTIREFFITEQGIRVAATFEDAEAMLTGVARVASPSGRGGSGRQPRRGAGT